MAEMGAAISGAAPILPAMFTPSGQVAARSPESALGRQWSPPLLERRIAQADRDDAIAPELDDAILRIESFYDPTRVDPIGEAPRWIVRAGTASMNNVFGDRWHLADTDPNVNVATRYIALAWSRTSDDDDCHAFTKNRATIGGLALSALSGDDCARLARLRADQEESWTRMALAPIEPPTPIFAAPLPGARLSSQEFWAAQKARIAAIQARLRRKWRTPTNEAAR